MPGSALRAVEGTEAVVGGNPCETVRYVGSRSFFLSLSFWLRFSSEDGLVYGSYWVTFEGMVDNRMSYFFLCLPRRKVGDPPLSSSITKKACVFPLKIVVSSKPLSPIENFYWKTGFLRVSIGKCHF